MRVQWSANESAEVPSPDALERLIDVLHDESSAGRPRLVEVVHRSGDILTIGVGRNKALLSFVPASKNPPYYVSVGCRERGAEMVTYDFYGESTEFPSRFLIPMQDARRALKLFAETGALSKEINWEET